MTFQGETGVQRVTSPEWETCVLAEETCVLAEETYVLAEETFPLEFSPGGDGGGGDASEEMTCVSISPPLDHYVSGSVAPTVTSCLPPLTRDFLRDFLVSLAGDSFPRGVVRRHLFPPILV